MFRLRGVLGSRGVVFDLQVGKLSIGSSKQSDLRVSAAGVSRRHASLLVTKDGLVVRDLGSKNGTFVDGHRVSRAALGDGSRLALGPVELTVQGLEDGAELAIRFDGCAEEDSSLSDHEWSDTLLVEVTRPETQARDERCSSDGIRLRFPEGYVLGRSSEMRRLYRQMGAVCRLRAPVLLHGETGVGKEMLARALHDSSAESERPYVVVNCAAIPPNLLEAELFGIVKGAATGIEPRTGYFARARGGTLFLDEIGELSPTLQAKLLRVLQEGEVQPVGGRPRPLDAWIIAATNVDLASDRLRRDLYFRFAAGLIEVPPLRCCRDDIPALIRHYAMLAGIETGVELWGVTTRALDRLRAHSWPGNIRELAQLVRRLVALEPPGGILDLESLPEEVGMEAPRATSEASLSELEDLELKPRIEELERRLIREAMIRSSGRQIRAAELLGLSRSGLAKKLKRLGLADSWARSN